MGCKVASVVIPSLGDNEAVALLLPRLGDQEIVVSSIRGLAHAVKRGIEKATGEVVIVMDGDGLHCPETMPAMIDLLDGADIVVAQRSYGQTLISRLGNWLARTLLRLPVRDCTTGFYCAGRENLLSLPEYIWHGYGDYMIALLVEAKRRKWSIATIDFEPGEREIGQSHTKLLKHSLQYLWRVWRLLYIK